MRKQYWFIILAYVLMQLSAYVGLPLLYFLGVGKGQPKAEAQLTLTGVWSVIAFTLCLVIVLLILRTVPKTTLRNRPKASVGASIGWAVAGVFLALFAQTIAASIEMNLFGVNPESENTQRIMEIITALPLMVFVSSVFGPILEEIIFRKIIFGAIYEKTNFSLPLCSVRCSSRSSIWISAICSFIRQWDSHSPFYMSGPTGLSCPFSPMSP